MKGKKFQPSISLRHLKCVFVRRQKCSVWILFRWEWSILCALSCFIFPGVVKPRKFQACRTCDLSRAEDQRLNQKSFLQIFLQVFLKLDLLQFCMWESDWWHCIAFHCIFQIKMFIIKQLAKAVILDVTEKFCSLFPTNFWCGQNKKIPIFMKYGKERILVWVFKTQKWCPHFCHCVCSESSSWSLPLDQSWSRLLWQQDAQATRFHSRQRV